VIDEPLAVVAKLATVLDKLRVSYAVGGSVASSLHGVPRATNDDDLVADLRPAHVDRLVAAIENDFYVDADMIRSALADRSSFNVLDQATMTKVDVFVPGADPWIIEELVRARAETIDIQGQQTTMRLGHGRGIQYRESEHTNTVLLTLLRSVGLQLPEIGEGRYQRTMGVSALEV
jgi:hypothetical protein